LGIYADINNEFKDLEIVKERFYGIENYESVWIDDELDKNFELNYIREGLYTMRVRWDDIPYGGIIKLTPEYWLDFYGVFYILTAFFCLGIFWRVRSKYLEEKRPEFKDRRTNYQVDQNEQIKENQPGEAGIEL
jgi:hypothetical protein